MMNIVGMMLSNLRMMNLAIISSMVRVERGLD
jgi:hypothetical protein